MPARTVAPAPALIQSGRGLTQLVTPVDHRRHWYGRRDFDAFVVTGYQYVPNGSRSTPGSKEAAAAAPAWMADSSDDVK